MAVSLIHVQLLSILFAFKLARQALVGEHITLVALDVNVSQFHTASTKNQVCVEHKAMDGRGIEVLQPDERITTCAASIPNRKTACTSYRDIAGSANELETVGLWIWCSASSSES